MKTTRTSKPPLHPAGYSFIEVLVVLVVVFILATVIGPSRMEQGGRRAQVSRAKSDMRGLTTAIEAYYVHNNEYPAMAHGPDGANARLDAKAGAYKMCTFRLRHDTELHTLTTPVSYITSLYSDSFANSRGAVYGYRQFAYTWILISYGIDRDERESVSDHFNTVCEVKLNDDQSVDLNFEPTFVITIAQPSAEYLATVHSRGSGYALIYDPTNGALSEGDIVRVKQ